MTTPPKSLEERIIERWENFQNITGSNYIADHVRAELQELRGKVVSRRKIRGVLSLGFLIGAQNMINEILIDIDEAMK